ncbi:hypothetical protein [Symbioplanes lichenis]|uniref:hypothetical protein n=1 Tax=Symbioplanes lichenis TaxID=1629072 RepID=UPI002739CEC3|nr:hypothetical protein [Actinoplanes lichenis]
MIEEELRERFGTVVPPASRLRVDELVAGGRRSARRRRAFRVAGGAALAAGVLVAVPSFVRSGRGEPDPQVAAAGAIVRCEAAKLPVPAGLTQVELKAVDPTGRYVVGNDVHVSTKLTPEGKLDGIGTSHPVLWTGGSPTALPLAGKKAVYAAGVNASGTVVASGGDDKTWDSVIRYTAGVPTELRLPAGDWEIHMFPSINAAGDVVATVGPVGGPLFGGTTLLWKAGTTDATVLPLPEGGETQQLRDDGRIFGFRVSGAKGESSWVWDQRGAGTELKAPAGQTALLSAARGDYATGTLSPSGAVGLWNVRTGAFDQVPITAPVAGVNDKGWMIIDSAVYRADTDVTLAAVDGVTGTARDLSDTGTVIGTAGTNVPVQWSCAS